MFDGLFIASIIGSFARIIKESTEPTIPSENWANKELYHQDLMNGVPVEERIKNLKNGKYRLEEKYPKPHRNKDGKIVIENCLLYNEDIQKYGRVQTVKWAKQGRYNLMPKELEKERERIKKELKHFYN